MGPESREIGGAAGWVVASGGGGKRAPRWALRVRGLRRGAAPPRPGPARRRAADPPAAAGREGAAR